MSETKYIVSYGAGVNSTAMIIHLVKNKMPVDHVVFADTGGEMPETYEYLEVMHFYLAKFDIPFTVVHPSKMRGLLQRCQERRVFPSQMWRWCTRDTKVHPIHKFYKKQYPDCNIVQYIGIDSGEKHRQRTPKQEHLKNSYPLIDENFDRNACIAIIESEGLPLPIKSGCFFCPFNNVARWKIIKQEHPLLFKKAVDLERKAKFYPRQRLAPFDLTKLDNMKAKDTDVYCGGGFA